jgi:hypothetical protein
VSIIDYYKCAQFATAAYVRAGNLILGSSTYAADFAELARSQSDGRLPSSIAQYLLGINEAFPNPNPWNVRYYYGGDAPGINDKSGLAATLFRQGDAGETVLAIRGVEGELFGNGDLFHDSRSGSDQCNPLS